MFQVTAARYSIIFTGYLCRLWDTRLAFDRKGRAVAATELRFMGALSHDQITTLERN